jgi:hypothetical protein
MSQFKEVISELSSIIAPSQHSAVDQATKESRAMNQPVKQALHRYSNQFAYRYQVRLKTGYCRHFTSVVLCTEITDFLNSRIKIQIDSRIPLVTIDYLQYKSPQF